MVEVFCTDVQCPKAARGILSLIKAAYPYYKVNFDLEDCDKILRVESSGSIETETIISLLILRGYSISVLEDIIHSYD
ncbi:MAG TPA: hypothetical protein VK921_04815 [Anditalea sp.]|nr:hypothetical protein [Anditalea sp.]